MKKTKRNLAGLEKRLAVLRTTVKTLSSTELTEVHGGCPCYSQIMTQKAAL